MNDKCMYYKSSQKVTFLLVDVSESVEMSACDMQMSVERNEQCDAKLLREDVLAADLMHRCELRKVRAFEG